MSAKPGSRTLEESEAETVTFQAASGHRMRNRSLIAVFFATIETLGVDKRIPTFSHCHAVIIIAQVI